MIGRPYGLLALGLIALAGCASGDAHLRHSLNTASHPALSRETDLEAHYAIRCPDVLAIEVRGRTDLCTTANVEPNGRITLAGQPLHVSGLTVVRIRSLVAHEFALPRDTVRVRVAEYNSQQIYLSGGDLASARHIVRYRGPETVVDLLRRVDLGRGAELGEVCIVRAHVADGKPPEVFHVDLRGVLVDRDGSTNIRLEPSDHIHIGQRQPHVLVTCLPPWLREMGAPVLGTK